MAGTLLFCSCKTNLEKVQELTEWENVPGVIAYNFEILYTENGKTKVKVLAPESRYYQFAKEPYNEFPQGITVYNYNDSLEIMSTLTANYAIFYDEKKLWNARYDVVAMNAKGQVLNTEQLFWDQNTKRIYSHDMVKITDGDDVLFGEGMESDETFDDWEILKPSGNMYVKEE
ncbi:MAG: LPS export ABC transporter periplasmic protein LptC [Bacteroidales bacterium]|nr:LPS export ABC transporter periplasmic protein LptC [Bacteroidales bacterium]